MKRGEFGERQQPGLQRALELFVMGDLTNARREWRFTTREMTSEELLAAGQTAMQWGWHRKAIQSTIDSAQWDQLDLRFPVAYPELILVQARAADLDPDDYDSIHRGFARLFGLRSADSDVPIRIRLSD